MTQSDIKKIVENLIQTFLDAGKISIDLRKKGLTKEIKSDNTPVSNGDLEVNKILSKKILSLTPNIPIVSEETSENKSKNRRRAFSIRFTGDDATYIKRKGEMSPPFPELKLQKLRVMK